ncbi:capsular exopolysaccharide family protein [Calothrix sp. NIES-3974]|nr:capsular exopolysaccharide family protein [Calothrix sp. NIES-3974]
MVKQMPTREQSLQVIRPSQEVPPEAAWVSKRFEFAEQSNALAPIWGLLRRRLFVIASVAICATTASWLWSSTRTPKYEGRFQLLVEPLKTSDSELVRLLSKTLQENVNELSRQTRTELDYQALMEVLKSPKVIDPVVQDLKTLYPDITYDQLVGNTNGKPAAIGYNMLMISRITQGKDESRVIEVRYRHANPRKIEEVLGRVADAYRKYSSEQQQSNLRQGIKFVDQQIPQVRLRVNTLQAQLQSFQQRYGVFNPDLQGEQLIKQLDQVKTQRLETERKFAEARSLYVSLQQQIGMRQNEAIAASALSESPQYQQLMTRVRELDAKIAEMGTRYTENSPMMINLREERQKLMGLMQQEAQLALGTNRLTDLPARVVTYQNSVRRDLTQQLANTTNQLQALQASLQSLVQTEAQLEQQIKEYPAVSRQYINLQRDLQAATDTLDQLLKRKEALGVDAAQQDVPWELIMPPTIPRNQKGNLVPYAPTPSRDIILGAIGGLLLGTCAAFVMDNLQDIFNDSEEVRRATRLPLLGAVPYYQEMKKPGGKMPGKTSPGSEEVVLDPKAGQFAQAFCSLYNRIHAYTSESAAHTLTVTSVGVNEGKSTVAANLAQIAAQAGKRVLLVDANLRRPQVHEIVNLVNLKGLSEYLEEGVDFSDVVGLAPQEDNLFIVTAGKTVKNPTKVLSSERMQSFINQAENEFDLIIFDTSHLLGKLDTTVLAQQTDGMVLVVGLGKVTRSHLKQAVEELRVSQVPVWGVITNNLRG